MEALTAVPVLEPGSIGIGVIATTGAEPVGIGAPADDGVGPPGNWSGLVAGAGPPSSPNRAESTSVHPARPRAPTSAKTLTSRCLWLATRVPRMCRSPRNRLLLPPPKRQSGLNPARPRARKKPRESLASSLNQRLRRKQGYGMTLSGENFPEGR